MARALFYLFDKFPDDARRIGSLVGYGEIEFELALVVGAVLKDDDQAIRVLFRTHGEEQRIEIADALSRGAYEVAGLADCFNEAIGAINWCKKIRNQYAHSHWMDDDDGFMQFASMDAAADKRAGEVAISFSPILSDVLEMQVTWFEYTANLLRHLSRLYEWKAGGSSTPRPKAPQRVSKPPLNNLKPKCDDPKPKRRSAQPRSSPSPKRGR
jgi:hypothetical protein